jgi:trehalose-6-phosphate synthase
VPPINTHTPELKFPRELVTTPNGVEFQGKYVTVAAFPIGIDPEKFVEGLQKPKVQARIAALERKFEGVKLIVGVDRLDYIKGVPQKLHALEVFLTEHPEWIGKIVLVQVAVPSRQDVEEYQNLRAVVNELVGRINGKFGKFVIQEMDKRSRLTKKKLRDYRIHAYSLSPPICLIRRAHCPLCRFGRLPRLVNPRWHEPRLL